ncbi:BMP family ABC transporter substrate-binding protein [Campylobacterota bacterium]|nr:BMP family ABC transporter substrate-binding protein [Campylobacterota bacterium]
MKKKIAFIILFLVVGIAAIIGFVFYGMGETDKSAKKRLTVENITIGVLYITDPARETGGYTYAHDVGIKQMQRELGLLDDQILRKVNIHEFDKMGVESAMRDLIVAGADIVIATSWGYMDICEKLAAEFPKTIFAHASGYKRNETNFTNYFGRIYQARYLSGIAAGLKTRTNKIGFVAAMGKDNSEVTGGLNAFALGVARVNPDARVFVSVTNSWFDPIQERLAAQTLITIGSDVIAQHCDTTLPMIEAEKAGVWGIGYNTDMSKDAPKAVIASVVWSWGAYYTHLVRSVISGSFTTAPYFGGIAEKMVDLTPLAPFAANGTEKLIASERKRILYDGFNVFDGVIATNEGGAIGREGATLSDDEIQSGIHWYYQNIVEIGR